MDEKRTPQPKRPYIAPTLTTHGDVVERTLGLGMDQMEVTTYRTRSPIKPQ